MQQNVLIDTDIGIDFLRGISKAKELIIPLFMQNKAFLSLLSVYELYAGMRPSENEVTHHFIEACNIVPLTVEIAKCASDCYKHFRNQDITVTSIDCLIWGTAKINDYKLATRNVRHYSDKSVLLEIS